MDKFENGKLLCPANRDGILYLATDGAALNTRFKDDNGYGNYKETGKIWDRSITYPTKIPPKNIYTHARIKS